MGINRRYFLGGITTTGIGVLSGCSEGTSSDDSSNQQSGTGSSEQNCHTVTRQHEEVVLDEWDSYSAGGGFTWRATLEEGEVLIIDARMTDGARPSLIVDDPSGNTLVDIGPSERINRQITAHEEGRYYIEFHNEALATTGQWDVDITWRTEYEEEVCD